MRKLLLLFAFFLIFSISDIAEAHSGRTDSRGGHNCSAKSQAKGLCTGYHYHNGGGDTSSGGTLGTTTTQSSDKDCSDFSSYEEVVNYWNSKGYSKTNDPERLDGFGNKVDDGIPCEPPNGYDTSQINGSPEQIAEQNAAKDKAQGKEDGYAKGLQDGYMEKEKNSTPSKGSEAYKKGYGTNYIKGYEEGHEKIEAEKKQAVEEGYAIGKETDELKVPSKYNENNILKSAFESGFKRAINEKVKAKKEEYKAMGYKNGKDDVKDALKDVEEDYLKAYQEGYEKGQKELKQSYFDKGYQAAFTILKYKKPNFNKENYINWYKEGFESNKEVIKIQEMAYNMGLSGKELEIPEKYIASEEIFNHHYDLGAKVYEEKEREETVQTTVGFGVLLAGWLGRRFYVAKKMVI
ncbi:YHYH domain-containing protein [Pseudalkalibacillus decolorationis]|uniref:YHYH domain-containing protein n=1 Tax=Pseudalkalibacillus decolorationis TaxID=163879 RepID=UPI002147B33D|nr:YHYH domain-containing protein [Pseudalkalibacillus decolorationis]